MTRLSYYSTFGCLILGFWAPTPPSAQPFGSDAVRNEYSARTHSMQAECDTLQRVCRASIGTEVNLWITDVSGRLEFHIELADPKISEAQIMLAGEPIGGILLGRVTSLNHEQAIALATDGHVRLDRRNGLERYDLPELSESVLVMLESLFPVALTDAPTTERSNINPEEQYGAFQNSHQRTIVPFMPNTKPQIEFAIRAQQGESLHDATGHRLSPKAR